MDIYKQYDNRGITIPTTAEGQVLESIGGLSDVCQENILMLETELRYADPDINDRCGLLNDQYEIYAMTIPACRSARLAISLDLKGGVPAPAMLHGAVSALGACQSAKNLTLDHRTIINRFWEPTK